MTGARGSTALVAISTDGVGSAIAEAMHTKA